MVLNCIVRSRGSIGTREGGRWKIVKGRKNIAFLPFSLLGGCRRTVKPDLVAALIGPQCALRTSESTPLATMCSCISRDEGFKRTFDLFVQYLNRRLVEACNRRLMSNIGHTGCERHIVYME
jgi:hypothetical protein